MMKRQKKILGYHHEHRHGYVVQDLQAKSAFLARNVIFRESEKFSLKSDSEVSFNDFPDSEEPNQRQYPNETVVRQQITAGPIVPSNQTASQEGVSQQLNRENESRDKDSEVEGSVPQRENNPSSISSCKLEARLEPK